jgi:hypothetical protein
MIPDTRPVIRANLIENMWSLIYTMAELNISFAQEERILVSML